MTREQDWTTLGKLAAKALLDDQGGKTVEREGDGALAAFAMFADIIERLDTILMEIRHLQTNLVYYMRAPELHAALRYEESYIFGSYTAAARMPGDGSGTQKDWSKLLGDRGDGRGVSLKGLPRLADAFVPFLPVANDEYGFDTLDGDLKGERGDRVFSDLADLVHIEDEWRQVVAPIARSLRRRRATGQEDDNYATSYRVFVALQGIKRNAVYDKLHIVWYGLRAFVDHGMEPPILVVDPREPGERRQSGNVERRSDFMIARAVVMRNIREHIAAMSDFQSFFETVVDTGVQDNHRPIIGRRREQGMYQFMLGERARDFYIEASRVVQTLSGKAVSGDIYRGLPVFVHRWSHAVTSKNRAVPSFSRMPRRDTYRTLENTDDPVFTRNAQSYTAFTVNTSFFMPDRPDLQPIIAHEAVHCVLLELFDQMEESTKMLNEAGKFADFWRCLRASKEDIDLLYKAGNDNGETVYTLRELVVDTIAASLSGVGYLYAMFQELCGEGMHELVPAASGRDWADIGALRKKLVARAIHPQITFQWYVRLRLCCHVVEQTLIKEYEKSAYTEQMIRGIRQILDDIVVRFSIIHSEKPSLPTTGEHGAKSTITRNLREVGNIVCEAADRSGICDTLRELRAGRYAIDNGTLPRRDEQPSRYPVFAEETKKHLVELYIERKLANFERPLHKALNHIRKAHDTRFSFETLDLSPFPDETPFVPATQLDEARSSRLAALDAVIAFAELYLYGEKTDLGARMDIRLLRKRIRYFCNIGDTKAADSSFQEILTALPCFVRLEDVAWQTSFFRSQEMAAQLGGDNRTPIMTMSTDFAPGREILQLAIEIWGHDRRLSIGSLSEVTRLQMNMLQIPVGATTNWRLAPSEDGEGPPLLERICDTVLQGSDKEEVAECLEHLAQSWEDSGALNLAKAARAVSGTSASLLRENMLCCIRTSIRVWLGSDLDADFLEVEAVGEFQDAAAQYKEGGAFAGQVDRMYRHLLAQDFAETVGRYDKIPYCETHERARVAVKNLDTLIQSLEDAGSGEEIVDELLASFRQRRAALPDEREGDAYAEAVADMMLAVLDRLVESPRIVVGGNFSVTIGPSATDRPGQGELRRLGRTESATRLIDDCIQALRIFEVSYLEKMIETYPVGGNFDGYIDMARGLGALQILKLDPGYPHLVMPLRPLRKMPWPFETLKSVLDGGERNALSIETCAPVTTFLLTRTVKEAPARARALIAVTAYQLLSRRMNGILDSFLPAFRAGVEFLDRARARKAAGDGTLSQAKIQPVTPRLIGDRNFARRTNMLAHHKMEVLRRSLAPPVLGIQELAPLRSLTGNAEPDEDGADNRLAASDVIRDTFGALSRGGAGLKVFRTLYLSRQSLIDTHWWREVERSGAKTHSVGTDTVSERLNGSFYHEVPHNAEHYGDRNGRDLPNVPAMRRIVTLGRYDFFNFSNSVVFGQQRLPLMDRSLGREAREIFRDPGNPYSKFSRERVFRSFFMRGEFALSLALRGEPVDIIAPELIHDHGGSAHGKDIIAILSLRLDRRSSRLAFVERLRSAAKDWAQYANATDKIAGDRGLNVPIHDLDGTRDPLDGIAVPDANRYMNPAFRLSVARALERAMTYRRLHLQDDPEFLDTFGRMMHGDPGAGNPVEALCKGTSTLLEKQGNLPPLDRRPTRLGMLVDTARHFADLPGLSVEAAGPFIRAGDAALLGEGWGDLYIVMFCENKPAHRPGENPAEFELRIRQWVARGVRRLYDVFALQHALFQDYGVFRTETFFRPTAIPFAAIDKDRMQLSMSIRSREDREIDGVVQRTLRAARREIKAHFPRAKGMEPEEWSRFLDRAVAINHVPGRNDFEVTISAPDDIRARGDTDTPLHMRDPSKALELLHEIVGAGEADIGGGTEEILTRISFRHAIGMTEKD